MTRKPHLAGHPMITFSRNDPNNIGAVFSQPASLFRQTAGHFCPDDRLSARAIDPTTPVGAQAAGAVDPNIITPALAQRALELQRQKRGMTWEQAIAEAQKVPQSEDQFTEADLPAATKYMREHPG